MALRDFDGSDPAVEDDGHGSPAGKRTAPTTATASRRNGNLLADQRLGRNHNHVGQPKRRPAADSANVGHLRPSRHGNDGARHAEDADCSQQGEDGLDRRFIRQWYGQRQYFVQCSRFSAAQRLPVQYETQKRLAGRPFDSGKCGLLVSVVGQSNGRQSQPFDPYSSSDCRSGLVSRRAVRLPSGLGCRFLPPAGHWRPGSTRSRRLFFPGEKRRTKQKQLTKNLLSSASDFSISFVVMVAVFLLPHLFASSRFWQYFIFHSPRTRLIWKAVSITLCSHIQRVSGVYFFFSPSFFIRAISIENLHDVSSRRLPTSFHSV